MLHAVKPEATDYVKSSFSTHQRHFPPRSLFIRAMAFCLLGADQLPAAEPVPPTPDVRRAFGGIHSSVSPDGQWIAVSYQGAIGRVPSRGGKLTLLTRTDGWDVYPAWSADGNTLAYINAPNFNTGKLRLIRSRDGAPVESTSEVNAQGRLWFHPDGRRLLGRFSRSGLPDRVAWFNLQNGEILPVEGIPDSWGARLRGTFALSHDGRWILFAEHLDQKEEQQGNDGSQANLFKIPAEGGRPDMILQFPARIYELCWNSTGNGAYAVTDLGTAHNDVWYIPLGSPLGPAQRITTNLADEDSPSISQGGETLVYTDNSDGATALIRSDLSSGEKHFAKIDGIDFGVPTGTLRLNLSDTSSPGPVVARLSLKQKNGKFHAPVGALYRMTAGLGHFYCRNSTALSLPAGEYELLGFRGPEYRMSRISIKVAAGAETTVDVRMERWVNAAEEGWYSGENHIHANYGYGQWYNTPRTILDLCEGEDLRVCNLVVANSDGEAVFDREFFRGRPDPLSTPDTILYWNQEFRATHWGHMTIFNLSRLIEPIFTGFKDTTNPWDVPTNADIAERARSQGGITSYTHPTNTPDDLYLHPYSAKGLPVDAALGRIDTVDVMGWVYEPSLPFWYRLLNCGLRLPAAAGTDCFLNRVTASLPGNGRAYVQISAALSYEKWTAGLKAGRSFVSNGPMLEFSVDGLTAGDTVKLSEAQIVRIKGRARAQYPLHTLEVIHNGMVVATGQIATDQLSATIDQDLRLERGGWIALRTSGPMPRYWQGRNLAAHTNPIYLDFNHRPPDARPDVEYFLKWIDRLEHDLQHRNRMHTAEKHVQMQLDAARQYYREVRNRQ